MALSRLPHTFVKSFRHLRLFLLGLDGARCRGHQRGRDGDAADAEDEIQFRDHVRFANAKFGVTSHRSGFSHLRSFCRRVASHISLHKMPATTGQRLLEDGHEGGVAAKVSYIIGRFGWLSNSVLVLDK